MSEDTVKLKTGAPGDPMFDACIEAMDAMREATAPTIKGQADMRDGMTIVMTAAAMFAGVQAGTLLAIGALRNQDRRKLSEAALTNFRQGIEFGLSRALSGAAEHGGHA